MIVYGLRYKFLNITKCHLTKPKYKNISSTLIKGLVTKREIILLLHSFFKLSTLRKRPMSIMLKWRGTLKIMIMVKTIQIIIVKGWILSTMRAQEAGLLAQILHLIIERKIMIRKSHKQRRRMPHKTKANTMIIEVKQNKQIQ